jgi:hypothetical protein
MREYPGNTEKVPVQASNAPYVLHQTSVEPEQLNREYRVVRLFEGLLVGRNFTIGTYSLPKDPHTELDMMDIISFEAMLWD